MKRVRRRKSARKHGRQRVQIGAPDPSLTGNSGVAALAALAEFLDKLDVIGRLDRGIGSVKSWSVGWGAAGRDGAVPTAGRRCAGLLGSPTCRRGRGRALGAGIHDRRGPGAPVRAGASGLVGVETAIADLVGHSVDLLPVQRRVDLGASVTVDLDSTDVEVYGSKKQGVAYNYQGQRAGRPHPATWAEAGLTVAADLLAGNDDVRPRQRGRGRGL